TGGEGGDSANVGGASDGGPEADADAADAAEEAPVDASIPCTSDGDCASLEGPCADASCVGGYCAAIAKNEFGARDDGKYCTENDTCVQGACVGGTDVFCASSDSCHVGICDEASKGCKDVVGNDGAQCDDKDPCTVTGVCNQGVCSKGKPVD